jgi:hypothetical protein
MGQAKHPIINLSEMLLPRETILKLLLCITALERLTLSSIEQYQKTYLENMTKMTF